MKGVGNVDACVEEWTDGGNELNVSCASWEKKNILGFDVG